MATNINEMIKRNQRLLFTGIAVLFSFFILGIWALNKVSERDSDNEPVYEDELVLEPDLTGAVENTFDDKVSSQIITDVQTSEKGLRQELAEVTKTLQLVNDNVQNLRTENQKLTQRLDEIENNDWANAPVEDAIDDELVPQNLNRKLPQYQETSPQYQLTSPPIKKGQFERKVYTINRSGKGESSNRFYVPSGAFSNAIILEGADANAAVTAQSTDNTPMQFKLTGDMHLPSDKRSSKLKGCFVTAATYGDISSERAIVRLQRLSCLINGNYIDQAVQGHVAFYGKNGIKGVPVMRNGKVLGLAFGAGALGGLGSAVSQVGNTSVGIGATSTVSAADVARQSLGGGLSGAANKLADYYISRAEQYHPIIPIGAANRVEVVFQEGFWADFIKDEISEPTPANSRDVMASAQDSTGLPPDLQRQLGEIKKGNLQDFIIPGNK
ncbi:hypothetical protein FHQ26_00600 [Testudinibacter sp. TR-2022]|uniref:TrbI/VirB10 family protein n=1 Tax=Testudinibacter sp. TR-2022 TaxID=2585029 RepID=UPI00111A8990|nr:TrbI/VirB10 family protein [Testudinibacter sp. TR-2022]TNH04041.1 hypothetical protein FHQ22_05840 [Pasteurellaceae bacterium Phil31]TNH10174.1 hypothetical protein FHQ25_06135 [Testudinibacter sp. TR-2022]TNH13034.1 hypothetical protein FHQ26_00600 [Testudinibacter sp. TR-2022]